MHQEAMLMAKAKMFTMRMSEEDAAQLESMAQHFGLTSAGLIRMLVQREALAIGRSQRKTDPLDTRDKLREKALITILRAVRNEETDDEAASTDAIVRWMHGAGYDNRWKAWKEFPRMLNELRRSEYVVKKGSGYRLTTRGEIAAK